MAENNNALYPTINSKLPVFNLNNTVETNTETPKEKPFVPFSVDNNALYPTINNKLPVFNSNNLLQPNIVSPTDTTPQLFLSNNQLQQEQKEEEDIDLTEDMLRKDPQWIKDAKTIYKERTGKPWFGSDEGAARWLLYDQSWMSWNFTSMGKRAFEAGDWDENVSAAYLRTLNTYPESKITLRSGLMAPFAMLADIPTVLTGGWSMAGKALGGKAAQLAMRYSFKEQLKKRIAELALKKYGSKEIAEEISKRGGKGLFKKDAKKKLTKVRRRVAYETGLKNLEAFVPLGFAYTGIWDLLSQNVRKDIDPNKDDIDYIDSLIAGAAGGFIGAPMAMIAPQIAGRFGRSKFFKEALEEDIIHGDAAHIDIANSSSRELLDDRLERKLAKTADTKKIKGIKNNVLELLKSIITPGEEVLSIGGGRYSSKLKAVPEAKFIEEAGGRAKVSELRPNTERSNVPANTYIPDEELRKGNQDTVVVQNVFGLIEKEDEIVAQGILGDAAKSIKPDGQVLINVGPQVKIKGTTKKLKDPVSIRDKREGQIKDKKGDIDFTETIDDLKPVGPKDTPMDEQGRIITEQITTSLGEKDLVRMLLNDFRDVTRKIVNGETIYIAKKPIHYTPRNIPKPNSKTFFQKIEPWRKKYFSSTAGIPKGLLDDFFSMKSAQRAVGKNIEAVWNKLDRAMNNRWLNKEGKKFTDWTAKEQEEGLELLDAALKGRTLKDTSIDARDSLPIFLRDSIDDMRENLYSIQKQMLKDGMIDNETDAFGTFVQRMGIRDKKGVLRAQKDEDGSIIEMHIVRQYEITNPSSKFSSRLKNTEAGRQRIEEGREYYRKMLLSGKTIDDKAHPLNKLAYEVQNLKYRIDRTPLLSKERIALQDEYDLLMGGEKSQVDELVNSFLKQYDSKNLKEISRLEGDAGFALAERLNLGPLPVGTETSAGVKAAFYGRKEIPPILRNLMGEYKDPFISYGDTIMKLQQNLHNFAFEKEIRRLVDLGKFPGLKAPRIDAFGNEAAPIGFKNLGEATKLARNMSVNTKTGIPQSGTKLPLENIQAEDVIFDAIQMGNDIAPLMNPYWKQFLKLQAMTRISKTAYSFAAQPRNFLGAALKAIAAGNLNIPQFVHTVKVMRGIGKLNDPKLTAQLEKWAYLDITGSGAKIGSIREALDEASTGGGLINNERRLRKAEEDLGKKAWYQAGRVNKVILDIYQSMDDMWKVYSFLNERKRYKKVLKDKMSIGGDDPSKVIKSWRTVGGERVEITVLDQYAAKMVGRHMDNYGHTSRAVKFARRLPAADFLAYKTEQVRTVRNIFETSFQDIKEGRALLDESNNKYGRAQWIQGYQRLGSIISAIGIPMGIAGGAFWNPEEAKKVILNIAGINYKLPYSQEEAAREIAIPDYAAGDHWMELKENKDGTKKYLNLTYWDPLGPFRAPVMAAFRASQGERSLDETLKKAFDDAGSNVWGNFGPSMLAEGLFAMFFDLDQYGRKITKPGDTMSTGMKKRVWAFAKAFYPNALKEVQRIADTTETFGEGFILPTGERGSLTEKGGFPMGRGSAIKRGVGFPEMVVDIKTSLPTKIAPIAIRLRDAQSIFKDELKVFKNLSEEDIIASYKKALDYEYNAMRDLSRLYVAAQAAGMDITKVWKSITNDGNMPTNFKERDVIAFVRGTYIPKIKPLSSDLFSHMHKLHTKGGVKSKIRDVQNELNEIRARYQGAPLFEKLERETIDKPVRRQNINNKVQSEKTLPAFNLDELRKKQ